MNDDYTTLPKDRKEWGMGETVSLWINKASWSDIDYLEDGYGGQISVADDIGDISWSVNGPGSVYPTIGDSTEFTAGPCDQDSDVTITAAIHDSGSKGADPILVQAMGGKGRVPAKVICIACSNHPDPSWKAAPPATSFGARGFFTFQVQPNTVKFNNYSIRLVSAAYTFKWNNPGQSYTESNFDTDYKLQVYSIKGGQWNLFDYIRSWGTFSVINFNGKDLPDPAGGSDYYTRVVDVWWKQDGVVPISRKLASGVTLHYDAEHAAKSAALGFSPSSAVPPTNPVLTGRMGPWQN